jgi:hypothetical protein
MQKGSEFDEFYINVASFRSEFFCQLRCEFSNRFAVLYDLSRTTSLREKF